LEISEENVKTRLHRARELLQRELYSAAGAPRTAFQFLGARCDRVVARVMARIQGSDSGSSAGRKFSRD